jgi:2-methylisocitrate lyase-like PEP mutase family enzyme
MTSTSAASRSTRFRELLEKPPFVCLGAHDAVTAKLAEAAREKQFIG